jgi:hypothetical protein
VSLRAAKFLVVLRVLGSLLARRKKPPLWGWDNEFTASGYAQAECGASRCSLGSTVRVRERWWDTARPGMVVHGTLQRRLHGRFNGLRLLMAQHFTFAACTSIRADDSVSL